MGSLVLVGTPIGNLGDLSPRAIEALKAADAIACEDTRRTGRLLQHAGVDSPRLLVVNDQNETDAAEGLVNLLDAGHDVALVTDAGMPGISDPGERVVAAVLAAGHDVTVVPGPTAVSAALVASGLPTARYVFEGFLPRKGPARTQRLLDLATEPRTVVLYEAPHRAERTLNDLANIFGPERRVAVARELTKLHEQVWRGTLADSVTWAADAIKGELVFVIEGARPAEPASDDEVMAELRTAIADGESKRDAVAAVADRLGVGKNRAYDLVNRIE